MKTTCIKEDCERHSHISLLPRAFNAFLPRLPREKVASSRMAIHSTLPLLMELRKETKLSSEPGIYVSNTRTAISLPWKGTRMINRAHTHTHTHTQQCSYCGLVEYGDVDTSLLLCAAAVDLMEAMLRSLSTAHQLSATACPTGSPEYCQYG